MKSVGFKNRDVMMIFLFQALLIGVIGGIVGIGLGAGAAYGLSSVFSHGSSNNAAPAASTNARGGGGAVVAGGPGGAGGSSSSISFTPAFPLATIGFALLIAIIVSIAAGLYPAWRASKMEPIDALRML
jgi:putative ABC transport system permease protein